MSRTFNEKHKMKTRCMDKFNYIDQPKTDCYIGLGDIIDVILQHDVDANPENPKTYRGRVVDVSFRKETCSEHPGYHPCVVIDTHGTGTEMMFWLEGVHTLEVVQFLGEPVALEKPTMNEEEQKAFDATVEVLATCHTKEELCKMANANYSDFVCGEIEEAIRKYDDSTYVTIRNELLDNHAHGLYKVEMTVRDHRLDYAYGRPDKLQPLEQHLRDMVTNEITIQSIDDVSPMV